MKKLIAFYFLLVALFSTASGLTAFSKAFLHAELLIADLKFNEANALLEKAYTTEKNDPQFLLLKHYSVFIETMITEDPLKYELLKESEKTLIKQLGLINQQSAWTQFSLAEIKIQTAVIRLKMGERMQAFKSIREAYHILKKNEAAHPEFLPNKKSMGWIESLVGSIPDNLDWVKKMTGLQGNIKSGEKRLDSFCNHAGNDVPEFLKWEAWFTLAYVNIHLAKNNSKAEWILDNRFQKTIHPLGIYLMTVSWNSMGNNEKVLESISLFKKQNNGINAYFLDFLEGQSKLRKLDLSGKSKLLKFLKFYEGANYRKRAYILLAMANRIEEDQSQYDFAIEKAISEGVAVTEEDKQAKKEALSGLTECVPLLKSRLLFDGDYYENALTYLDLSEKCKNLTPEEKVEIVYRRARIYHKSENSISAKKHYEETIKTGKNLNKYYAANSALQLGLIYENEKNDEKAKHFFELVINGFPKNREYVNSLNQKAKSGLQRLNESN